MFKFKGDPSRPHSKKWCARGIMTRCPWSWNSLGIQWVQFSEKNAGPIWSEVWTGPLHDISMHLRVVENQSWQQFCALQQHEGGREREQRYLNKFPYHAQAYLDRIMFLASSEWHSSKNTMNECSKSWSVDWYWRFLPVLAPFSGIVVHHRSPDQLSSIALLVCPNAEAVVVCSSPKGEGAEVHRQVRQFVQQKVGVGSWK